MNKGGPRRKTNRPQRKKKVVIRKIPHYVTEEEFAKAIQKWRPRTNWFLFRQGHVDSHTPLLSRPGVAYVQFAYAEDVFPFAAEMQQVTFSDPANAETPPAKIEVEYAPHQLVPRVRRPVKDNLLGTIEADEEYQKFLKSLEEEPAPLPSAEKQLEERLAKQQQTPAAPPQIPILNFIMQSKKSGARVLLKKDEKKSRAQDKKNRRRGKKPREEDTIAEAPEDETDPSSQQSARRGNAVSGSDAASAIAGPPSVEHSKGKRKPRERKNKDGGDGSAEPRGKGGKQRKEKPPQRLTDSAPVAAVIAQPSAPIRLMKRADSTGPKPSSLSAESAPFQPSAAPAPAPTIQLSMPSPASVSEAPSAVTSALLAAASASLTKPKKGGRAPGRRPNESGDASYQDAPTGDDGAGAGGDGPAGGGRKPRGGGGWHGRRRGGRGGAGGGAPSAAPPPS